MQVRTFLVYSSGLFTIWQRYPVYSLIQNVNVPLTMPPIQLEMNAKKKKKKSDSNMGKDFKLPNVSIYSRIYTAFDVHIAYGLGMFCCIYSKREASIYHRWWYYLWRSLTLILRVPIISIHVNKREQHSCSLWWFFPLKNKELIFNRVHIFSFPLITDN